jgi:lysophospholipase L1-like esterase
VIVKAAALLLLAGSLMGVAAARTPDTTPSQAEVCRLQLADQDTAPRRTTHGATSAALIGDSWSGGAGVFPNRLAERLGLDLRVAAFGGSGYINPSACGGRTFGNRVARIPVDARLVVLAGGINDSGYPNLAAAVRDLIEAVHDRAPAAQVVVLGVPRVPLFADELTDPVDQTLEEVAAERGALFVDVRPWTITTLPDRIHPDPAGARAYADQVAAALTGT